ncbi:hypothetical protein VTO42DRAFT_4298 [Malbranchea cinnamomea]
MKPSTSYTFTLATVRSYSLRPNSQNHSPISILVRFSILSCAAGIQGTKAIYLKERYMSFPHIISPRFIFLLYLTWLKSCSLFCFDR